ncbi:MAG: hypothetical protein ABSD13_06005 [Candidatus Korobacteraceae bacterium]|jgi:hypothetical protein
MSAHLNEQQFGDLILGTSNAAIAGHIEVCDVCRADAETVHIAISGCRDYVQQSAERDEIFWVNQRLAIKQRRERHHFAPYIRWFATAAMVLVVSAAFLVTRTPRPAQLANTDEADNVLLQGVQSDVERDYPAALAPAVLIDEERNSVLSGSAEPSSNH